MIKTETQEALVEAFDALADLMAEINARLTRIEERLSEDKATGNTPPPFNPGNTFHPSFRPGVNSCGTCHYSGETNSHPVCSACIAQEGYAGTWTPVGQPWAGFP